MQYRYFLNEVLLEDEAGGWDIKISTIKRDYSIKGILRLQDGQLIFSGDGYLKLKEVYDEFGAFEQVNIRIEKSADNGNNWRHDFKGLIFMAQVEWDDKRKNAKCKLQDDSYYARINNNKSVECFLHAGKSKNGVSIPVPDLWRAILFDPGAAFGDYSAGSGNTWSYRIYDVFAYLVAFMTDGEVEFASTYFGANGPKEKTLLTVGRSIRENPGIPSPSDFYPWWKPLTFQRALQEIDRKNNLFFIIEKGTAGKPVFRLEEYDYFFDVDNIHSITGINELKTKTDIDRLYSHLKIGSTTVLDDQANPNAFPELIQFLGVNLEHYPISGKTNVDKELDLSTSWIVSSNVIAHILLAAAPDYDEAYNDQFVLIECDGVFGGSPPQGLARQTNWLIPGPPFYYNEGFTNAEVAKRFLKAIPSSIVAFLGNSDNKFRAQKSADEVSTFPTHVLYPAFDDEVTTPNHDVNGNYDAAQSRFLVPRSGLYEFHYYIHTKNWTYFNFENGFISAAVQRWDNAMTTLISVSEILHLTPTIYYAEPILEGTVKIIANQGDYIRLATSTSGFQITYDKRSYWECVLDVDGGERPFQEYDHDDYSVLQHEFKHALTEDQFENIDADPRGLIEFARANERSRKGWIETIKFYHQKANADFLLDSSKTLNKR